MNYTLTKYLTSDYFRDNEFTNAFLDLVDEIIFCCYMESKDILSQLSFELMDDNYFLTYQSAFLDGLSTYDINNIDKLVLSEWFSLLHVRGELSDLFKLLKFGGSLTTNNNINNSLKLYNNADVPETITRDPEDGIIYVSTDKNITLNEDYFITQQTPAGYKLSVIKQVPDEYVYASDSIDLEKYKENNIIIIDVGRIDVTKEKTSDILFYRKPQFDESYTFKQLFKSGYTINKLSTNHNQGCFYLGFDVEIVYAEPVSIDETINVYSGVAFDSAQFLIENAIIEDVEPEINFILSGSFAYENDYITLEELDSEEAWIEYNNLHLQNYSLYESTIPSGGDFISNIVFDGMNEKPEFIHNNVQTINNINEPLLIINDIIVGGSNENYSI